MHLIPPDRAGRRMIDSDRVCDAIAALGDPGEVSTWAARYALIADSTRLSLLLCIDRVGPISVSDLSAATDLPDTTVSQALRYLRIVGAVEATRHGRVMLYTLADPLLSPLLDAVNPHPQLHHSGAHAAGGTH
jgi:DNA-binding transcriptional ArsR family regulator